MNSWEIYARYGGDLGFVSPLNYNNMFRFVTKVQWTTLNLRSLEC